MHESPTDPVPLMYARNEFEAGLVVDALREAGIVAKAITALTGDAYTSASTAGLVPVMVRREQVDAAKEALRKRREGSVDIDWAEVDVGEREPAGNPLSSYDIPWTRVALASTAALAAVVILLYFFAGGTTKTPPPPPPTETPPATTP